MTIENVMMTLNRIPEIKAVVDSGTDWKVLYGFAATALIVVLGAVVTIYTFRRTVAGQEKITKSLAIKDSRQAWINELRTACSEYVAAIMMLNAQRKNAPEFNNYVMTMVSDEASSKAIMEWNKTKQEFQTSILILKAKITLLSNPSEALFMDLIKAVESANKKADTIDSNVEGECDKIIEFAQKILKIEWDRTRRLE